jgi:hypothetical protein
MKHRRAVSLLELIAVMSACTMVMTLTGTLLHRVMRIHVQSREMVRMEQSALRLANQFRRDVHQAQASIHAGEPLLQLTLADGRTVAYSRTGDRVLRVESGGAKPTWREEFLCRAENEIEVAEAGEPRRLSITIQPGRPAVSQDAVPPRGRTLRAHTYVHAEAVVGSDLRFANRNRADEDTP